MRATKTMAGRLMVAGVLLIAAAAPAAARAAAPTLTPERFAALEPVLAAGVPLDAAEPTRADIAALRQSCATLPLADPLLAAQRRGCELSLRITMQTSATCASRRSCAARARSMRRSFAQLLAAGRENNRIVEREVGPGGCRATLRLTARDAAALRAMIAGLGHTERALRTGSVTELRRGARLLDRATALEASAPSQAAQLARFRSSCR